MAKDKKTKIITLCITSNDHMIIKIAAAKLNISMKELILTAVKEFLNNPKNIC